MVRTGPRLAFALLTAAAATAGVAAAEPASITVPNLAGKPRTQAEALLTDRRLLYKPRRPSSRYELPAGVLGVGNALTVLPEEQTPDRLVTGQDTPAGIKTWPGRKVEFATNPRPAGDNRMPLPIELAQASLAADGRSLTIGLADGPYADACRPLDHVDVAPRTSFEIVRPFVNVTDGAGACVRRTRTVSLELRRKVSPRPIVEREPDAPRDGLYHVESVPWERARVDPGGRHAVVYFWGNSGCSVYSHATVEPRGDKAAITTFVGTATENPVFCPLLSRRFIVLAAIPPELAGRKVVDGHSAAE